MVGEAGFDDEPSEKAAITRDAYETRAFRIPLPTGEHREVTRNNVELANCWQTG